MYNKNNINVYEEAYALKVRALSVARKINDARSGNYLPKDQFDALLSERSDVLHQACLFINEINCRINMVASNVFARLPHAEYKAFVEARKTARDAKNMLQNLVSKDDRE